MLTKLLVLSVSDQVKRENFLHRRAGSLRFWPLLRPDDGMQWEYCWTIRKSLITLNQDIPAFPLFVYRTQKTVIVIVKRQKLRL